MRKTSWYIHLLPVFKRQHRTVCVTEGFSRSEVNCYIENRTVQTRYQLGLCVFTFLVMQTSQRELLPAVSLVDLDYMEVDLAIYKHRKPAPEILKLLCFNYYWLYHCFLYSLGLMPSTFRNIRLK